MTEIDQLVQNLAGGYRAVVGENACKLSEGQKQRIAIARAIIKRPKILILDEAMSSLDSESEELLLARLKEFQDKQALIITVSHRLSTVMQADLVYYLEKPDNIIIDTPLNLLEKNPGFANLFAAQSRICV